jgi:hypothetical protein
MDTITRTISDGTTEILKAVVEPQNKRTLYWSRAPGDFVNKYTGINPFESTQGVGGPCFHGTVTEWYETFAETVIDAHNHIHRRQLRAPNLIETSRDVFTILSLTTGFRPITETKGKLAGFIEISCNPTMPNNELRMYLVSDYRITYIPGSAVGVLEPGNDIPQGLEPVLEKLDSMQVVDQMTIKVLNMNAI